MNKMIEIVFFGILFCLAAVFLFKSAENMKKIHSQIKSKIHNEVGYEAFTEEKEVLCVTGSDITALLMCDFLEYNILINNYTVTKELYSKYNIELIQEGVYKKIYQYDVLGNIMQIIFIKE